MLLLTLPLMAAAEPPASLRFGLHWREQGEYQSADRFGDPDARADTVWLHRLLLDAGWRAPAPGAAAFLQLGVYGAEGRNGGPSPVDESAPDLHQAYLDLPLGAHGLRLRAGRQEWSQGSGRLLSVRERPNSRRAFDALQVDAGSGEVRLRLRYGRPVRNEDGAFDDRRNPDEQLAGAQLTLPALAGVAELYALRYRRAQGRFAAGEAHERRESFGLRLAGSSAGWRYDSELVWQQGRFAGGPLRAWTVASDSSYRFSAWPGQPRLGLKLDVASGDGDPNDGKLETFNGLYPNPSYFSDATLIAPANLIDLQPYLQLHLSERIEMQLGWNAIWKHRRADAIYGTPVPLRPLPASAGGPRFVGHQQQLSAEWAASEHWRWSASYVHFDAGAGLRAAGGRSLDFLQLVLSCDY